MNTVNTEGVMGKGIALQFRQAYPQMFRAYEHLTKAWQHLVDKGWTPADATA